MKRRDIFWHLLLTASFVAAVVSFLTTALGLNRYVHFALAWPLAFAVQAGLFGLAWLLAVGRRHLRAVVVLLYCLTMPFSVVFSYVMLQSQFTAQIKPEEAQRALFDDLRERSAAVTAELGRGVAAGDDLVLRLESWLVMEQEEGWASATCDGNEHCYLDGVCGRVQRKIANWESTTGRPYQQGPGKELIYGLLESEVAAARQLRQRLGEAHEDWLSEQAVFAADLDNRERLRRFDAQLAGLPREELESARCAAVSIPPAPPYDDFARDGALAEERPVYAFEDLLAVLERDDGLDRGDYATLFSFGLALFIDLFVLLVAIGAALIESADDDSYPVVDPVSPEWSEDLERDIDIWIDGSLLEPAVDVRLRREFLSRVLEALRFERGSRAVLVPRDAAQSRFGYLLTRAQGATAAAMGGGDREPAVSFVLEDWVYPALARHLGRMPAPVA
jgi:hypothetical protein